MREWNISSLCRDCFVFTCTWRHSKQHTQQTNGRTNWSRQASCVSATIATLAGSLGPPFDCLKRLARLEHGAKKWLASNERTSGLFIRCLLHQLEAIRELCDSHSSQKVCSNCVSSASHPPASCDAHARIASPLPAQHRRRQEVSHSQLLPLPTVRLPLCHWQVVKLGPSHIWFVH